MKSFILTEGVLNDNELHLASKGKMFKGGYIALIKEYTFASAWHNSMQVKKFKAQNALDKYLAKNYPEFK